MTIWLGRYDCAECLAPHGIGPARDPRYDPARYCVHTYDDFRESEPDGRDIHPAGCRCSEDGCQWWAEREGVTA